MRPVDAMLLVCKRTPGHPGETEDMMSVATHPPVTSHDNSLSGARAWFAEKGLSRPRKGRLLAGVFASFARRYDVNPLVARVLGIATILILTPLLYVGAWILMPSDVESTA
jgi:phage shock protein PspC (stress-responsive transcriptional regulator)